MDALTNILMSEKTASDEACWMVLDKILFAMRILGNLRQDLADDNYYGFIFNEDGTVSAILSRFQETCGYTAAVHSRLFFPTARTNNSIASTLAAHGNIFFGQEPLAADRRIIIQLNGDTASKIPFTQLRASIKPKKPNPKLTKSVNNNTSSSSAANTSNDAAVVHIDESATILAKPKSSKTNNTSASTSMSAVTDGTTSASVAVAPDAALNTTDKKPETKPKYRSLVEIYDHFLQAYDQDEQKYIFNRLLSEEGKKDDFLTCRSKNGKTVHWMRLTAAVADIPYDYFCKNITTKQIARMCDIIGMTEQQGAKYLVRHLLSIPTFRKSALVGVQDAGVLARETFTPEETDELMVACKLNWPQLRSLNASLRGLFGWPVLSSERALRDLRNKMLLDEARAKLQSEDGEDVMEEDEIATNDALNGAAALPVMRSSEEADAIEAMSQMPALDW